MPLARRPQPLPGFARWSDYSPGHSMSGPRVISPQLRNVRGPPWLPPDLSSRPTPSNDASRPDEMDGGSNRPGGPVENQGEKHNHKRKYEARQNVIFDSWWF